MNKIYIAIVVLFVTFSLLFLVSFLLDIPWIRYEISRELTVYLMMAIILAIGFLTFKNIFK